MFIVIELVFDADDPVEHVQRQMMDQPRGPAALAHALKEQALVLLPELAQHPFYHCPTLRLTFGALVTQLLV